VEVVGDAVTLGEFPSARDVVGVGVRVEDLHEVGVVLIDDCLVLTGIL
jgi:hypothetical protein